MVSNRIEVHFLSTVACFAMWFVLGGSIMWPLILSCVAASLNETEFRKIDK